MNNHKCKRATKEANSIRSMRGLSALERGDVRESRYLRRKTDNFLPFIPQSKREGEFDCGWSFCDENSKSRSWRVCNKQTSSSTVQARQLMPTGFKHFWQQYKPSLAIQPSTIYQDVDAYSIEVIREYNEPHLVLPSLRNKLTWLPMCSCLPNKTLGIHVRHWSSLATLYFSTIADLINCFKEKNKSDILSSRYTVAFSVTKEKHWAKSGFATKDQKLKEAANILL